ncbi:MAG: FAD-binding oxidoreductase, partial [Opitutaceae bacterium]
VARAEKTFASIASPQPPPGSVGDASHLPPVAMEVATPVVAAEETLRTLLAQAAREERKVTIAGTRHSMGGHTLYPGGLSIDLRNFDTLTLDTNHRLLRAGAGARWTDVIRYLDARGYSVAVMQSNDDFSVGGSLSVNCHGWQHNASPIAGTVESLRVMLADGTVRFCSRTDNTELFRLVLGGYGLFGIILEAELRVVPNEFYRAIRRSCTVRDYVDVFREMTRADVGMAYGRISVAPDSFLQEASVTTFLRTTPPRAVTSTLLVHVEPPAIKRFVFRGSVRSDYGKNLRWRLEKWFGEVGDAIWSRNQIQFEPSGWFENRDPAGTDILHEYFLPARTLATFVERIAPILREESADLLNITVRNVHPDADTFLTYAPGERFGLVMLFHQPRTAAGEAAMARLTRRMIDAALACDGRYYLPYRLHATREQFYRSYPQAAEFFALKAKYDPTLRFQNSFYRDYGPSP